MAKRMIDLIALFKFNKLHWHLTEDEGWRIESKRFPKLHTISFQAINFQEMAGRAQYG